VLDGFIGIKNQFAAALTDLGDTLGLWLSGNPVPENRKLR
jgi:hypothetical protein